MLSITATEKMLLGDVAAHQHSANLKSPIDMNMNELLVSRDSTGDIYDMEMRFRDYATFRGWSSAHDVFDGRVDARQRNWIPCDWE